MNIKEIEAAWIKATGREDQYLIMHAEHLVPKLLEVAKAVDELPFGEHAASPWCRECFSKLDKAMNNLKEE